MGSVCMGVDLKVSVLNSNKGATTSISSVDCLLLCGPLGESRGHVNRRTRLVVNLRAIELGASEAFGPPSHSIQSIGIGVVFHTARASR